MKLTSVIFKEDGIYIPEGYRFRREDEFIIAINVELQNGLVYQSKIDDIKIKLDHPYQLDGSLEYEVIPTLLIMEPHNEARLINKEKNDELKFTSHPEVNEWLKTISESDYDMVRSITDLCGKPFNTKLKMNIHTIIEENKKRGGGTNPQIIVGESTVSKDGTSLYKSNEEFDVSHLRIGNYVLQNNFAHWGPNPSTVEKVVDIGWSYEFGRYVVRRTSPINDLTNKCGSSGIIPVTGVPITEEWLVKLGYKYEDFIRGIKWSHLQRGKIMIDKVGGSNPDWQIGINKNFSCLIFIQYIHQLQNLHFVLTGEELIAIK